MRRDGEHPDAIPMDGPRTCISPDSRLYVSGLCRLDVAPPADAEHLQRVELRHGPLAPNRTFASQLGTGHRQLPLGGADFTVSGQRC